MVPLRWFTGSFSGINRGPLFRCKRFGPSYPERCAPSLDLPRPDPGPEEHRETNRSAKEARNHGADGSRCYGQPRARITGIRLWVAPQNPLGVVVRIARIVKIWTTSASGFRQRSQSPANANSDPRARRDIPDNAAAAPTDPRPILTRSGRLDRLAAEDPCSE